MIWMAGFNILPILFLIFVVFIAGIFATSLSDGFKKYEFIDRWGSKGSGDGEFDVPHSMTFDKFGNIYITDTHNNRIQKFSSEGKFITKWGTQGSGDGEFINPEGIDIDSKGDLYIA